MKKLLMLAVFALPLLAACDRKADFEFGFANRDSTGTHSSMVNGGYYADVGQGGTGTFMVELEILESSPTGPRTADVARVTVAAYSHGRKKVSKPRPMDAYTDRINWVTIEPHDFR